MPAIPRDWLPDATLPLLADPYRWVGRRCRRHGTDLFETRLLLARTICLTGPAAAEFFYDTARVARAGAPPNLMRATLLGRGAVMELDDAAHRHRKAMLLGLFTPDRVAALAAAADAEWDAAARRWAGPVPLYDEARRVLCRAVHAWAGVPLPDAEVETRTADLTLLYESPGAVGPTHLRGRLARRRLEATLSVFVEGVRAGRHTPPAAGAAHVVARHQDHTGHPLNPNTAAVELLNVLRPAVAVSVFVTFVAHALHAHPAAEQTVRAGGPGYAEAFVSEVRRWYPFFPAAVGRVRRDCEWNGYPLPGGVRVLFDLYGTNRDPRAWEAPDEFRPDRFLGREPSPFAFVPQGGGEHATGHRCAGEAATVALMLGAARFLTRRVSYTVPPQDLRIDMGRLPALPRSRFVLADARPA